jgi:hypothetical protein
MMGDRRIDQAALFHEFSRQRHVPADHMLRSIDRFVDLEGVRSRGPRWPPALAGRAQDSDGRRAGGRVRQLRSAGDRLQVLG